MEGPRRAEDTSNLSDVPTAPGALPRISRSKNSWFVTLSRLPPSEIFPTPQSTKCTLCPSCTPSSTTACLAPFTPRSSMDDLGRRERTGRRHPDSGPSRIKMDATIKRGARDLSIDGIVFLCDRWTVLIHSDEFYRAWTFQQNLPPALPFLCSQLSLCIESDLVRLFKKKMDINLTSKSKSHFDWYNLFSRTSFRFARHIHAGFERERKIMFLNLFWVLNLLRQPAGPRKIIWIDFI